MSRRFWTEEKIKTEIQKLFKSDEDLWYRAMERNHKDLIRASERYFKGWKNAIEAAGIDYDLIKKRSHQVWTEEKILEQLNTLRLENPNLRSSFVQQNDKKLYHAAIRTYKTFKNALSKVEEKYGKVPVPGKAPEPVKAKVFEKTVSETKPEQKPEKTKRIDSEMKIFTVRTRIRSERYVGEAIEKKANNLEINIGTIQYPTILNGYIFVECDDREALNRIIKNIRNAQGLLNGETTLDEITKYVKSTKSKKVFAEGSNVEITEGQFKGKHAVIKHMNDRTKEVTVELIDEIFKIPIVLSKKVCKII